MELFFDKLDTLNNSLSIYRNNKEKLKSSIYTYVDKHNNKLDINLINQKLDNIIDKMDEINEDIEYLQYEIDTNQLNKDDTTLNRINQQEIDSVLFPLMMIYKMFNSI